MYQSVLAKTLGQGSSGIGFAFALVDIKDIHPDRNICLVSDLQTGAFTEVGLDKRDSISWPQVGDRWIIDRSLGHWALRCKVTATTPPVITGSRDTIPPTLVSLLGVLEGLGLIKDETTAPTVPLDVWALPALLNGFAPYTVGGDSTVRYRRNYDSTVTVEGRLTPPGSVPNGTIMFSLPGGFRPVVPKYQTTMVADGVAATITYSSDGSVALYDFGAVTPIRVLFHMRYSLVQ